MTITNVVKNLRAIPPKSLCKNTFSGLAIPLLIERKPTAALKVVIASPRSKDLKFLGESISKIDKKIRRSVKKIRNKKIYKKNVLGCIIYQVS